jgi:hypothetical protein
MDDAGILRCLPLCALGWLEHGFESRHSSGIPTGFGVARLKQIHSAIVIRPTGTEADCGEGDALIADQPGRLLVVRTADCVPILLVDPTRKAVAAVHAGWRGVVAGVLPHALSAMRDHCGTNPGDLLAALGPCIRHDAFEVGPEVAMQFQDLFPERSNLNQRTHVDLAEACQRQLAATGVPAAQVFDCGCCSFADGLRWHSYRRDRESSGRMQAFIGVRP